MHQRLFQVVSRGETRSSQRPANGDTQSTALTQASARAHAHAHTLDVQKCPRAEVALAGTARVRTVSTWQPCGQRER